MILRDYQQQAVESVHEALQEHDSDLIVLPTGTGKTVVFGEIIRQYMPKGRVMVIAHREELLDQACEKIKMLTGITPGLEMAEFETLEGGLVTDQVVVSSVQTHVSGWRGNRRMHKFNPDDFSLLVIDEAHHAAANTYRAVIDHYRSNESLKVLGVTATPDRLDEKALGDIFESVSFDYEIITAIQEGWLVPVKQRYLSVEIDFQGVRYTLGDFNGKELRELLAEGSTLEQIASDTIQYAGDRLTLVFSDCISNAERLTEAFNRNESGSAYIITGQTPKDERRRLVAAYRASEFQYLVNVGIATEGFDVPEIACVVQARPTCSRSLYAQQAGRGTRPLTGIVDAHREYKERCAAILASGKPDLLILDIVGNSKKHKLIHAGDLLGGDYSDEVIELAEREAVERGAPVDVLDGLEQSQLKLNAQIQAEADEKERLAMHKRSQSEAVDPFGVFGLQDLRVKGWDDAGRRASGDQVEKLKKWGIEIKDMSGTQADTLINEFRKRTRRGLCTYKQSKQLIKRWGMTKSEARNTSFGEAGRIITILAANKWQKPKGAAINA